MDDKMHKDTSIAIEEVRRGLISFTETNGRGDLPAGVEESLPVVGSTAGF